MSLSATHLALSAVEMLVQNARCCGVQLSPFFVRGISEGSMNSCALLSWYLFCSTLSITAMAGAGHCDFAFSPNLFAPCLKLLLPSFPLLRSATVIEWHRLNSSSHYCEQFSSSDYQRKGDSSADKQHQ